MGVCVAKEREREWFTIALFSDWEERAWFVAFYSTVVDLAVE